MSPLAYNLSEYWREQFISLVARNRIPSDKGDFAACGRLAPQLCKEAGKPKSWSASYLYHILHPTEKSKVGKHPSPVFTMAVQSLAAKPPRVPRVRHDKPRVYVPVANEFERQQINNLLSAAEKRSALLAATERKP